MYLDSAYIAKFYVNERDSPAVRGLIEQADSLVSSSWALGEVHCVLHRHMREGSLTAIQCETLAGAFLHDVDSGVWKLIPVSDVLLRRASRRMVCAPADVFLRTGDAVHLHTATEMGEKEIWTNDRHMLAAAPHFGLVGRSVLQQ
jgi:predicted nucleic acid-binding protein